MKKTIIFTLIVVLAGITSAINVHAQSYTFDNDLHVGSTGQDVSNLQTWLMSNGFSIPSISTGAANRGYFGSQTQAAVVAYQRSIGLPAYGFFGPITRTYWFNHFGNGYQNGPLRVTSPNGGETWQKGTTQYITWTVAPGVQGGTADIKLEFPVPACAQQGSNWACMTAMRAPLTIASGISLNSGSYAWNVGNSVPLAIPCDAFATYCPNQMTPIVDGQYKIQICPTNANSNSQCDDSDNYFNITSPGVSNGQNPVINGIDTPTSLSINQTGTWTVHATDPQNGTLSYSVNWGDVVYPVAGYSATAALPQYSQSTTFTHSYSSAGTYTVTFTVRNSSGLQAQTSSTVVVGSTGTAGSLKVISPNGGETWGANSTHQITWSVSGQYDPNAKVDIYLVVGAPCPTNVYSGVSYLCPPLYTLDKNIAINATYNWITGTDMNNNQIPAGNYFVRICLAGSATNCDQSDNYFTISSQNSAGPLKIISPNGGETWTRGTNQSITWTSPYYFVATTADLKLVPYQAPCVTQVCPMYMLAPYTIATGIQINQNSYVWNVGYVSYVNNPANVGMGPNPVSDGQYTIQICQSGTSNCDSSDSTFTITSNQTANLPDIDIISPNGGEVWRSGSIQTVTVNVTGDQTKLTNDFVNLFLENSSGNGNLSNGFSLGGGSINGTTGIKSFQVTLPTNYLGQNKIYAMLNRAMPAGNCPIGYTCVPGPTLQAYDYSDSFFTITN